LLSLRIVHDSSRLPPLPDPETAGTEVWRDVGGRILALGERHQDARWMHILAVGSYEFSGRSNEVRAYPNGDAGPQVVADQYRRTVLPLALQAHGFEALHASAVRTPNGVLAFCAVKESGKSTLAFALGQKGYPLWADDAVVLAFDEDGVAAAAVPFEIRLRPASSAYFSRTGSAPPATAARPVRDLAEPLALEQAPLAALFVLERERAHAAAGVELRRLGSAEAFTAVLEHAYCFTLEEPETKRRMMRQYLSLVARVPVFRLSYPTGLDHLPEIVAEIERTIRELEPAARP
jgi:hypothetical protein